MAVWMAAATGGWQDLCQKRSGGEKHCKSHGLLRVKNRHYSASTAAEIIYRFALENSVDGQDNDRRIYESLDELTIFLLGLVDIARSIFRSLRPLQLSRSILEFLSRRR